VDLSAQDRHLVTEDEQFDVGCGLARQIYGTANRQPSSVTSARISPAGMDPWAKAAMAESQG
jgi:hypothetical protein